MATEQNSGIIVHGDRSQRERHQRLVELLKNCPIPDNELLLNLGLYLVPQTLSRILFLDFLYRQILEVQGVILDLGTRWGQNAVLFTALRGIYEPYNRLRKVIGFDTFEGFLAFSEADGDGEMMKAKNYSVTAGYKDYLDELIDIIEKDGPLEHIKKHDIISGDAIVRLKEYLEANPETIVALAYFDFDLYEPTKECLLTIRDRLTRGSVLAFDELNENDCPGETLAVKEVLGLDRYPIRRFNNNARTSYLIID